MDLQRIPGGQPARNAKEGAKHRALTTSRKCGVPGEGLPARDENLLLIFDISDSARILVLRSVYMSWYLLSRVYSEGRRG